MIRFTAWFCFGAALVHALLGNPAAAVMSLAASHFAHCWANAVDQRDDSNE